MPGEHTLTGPQRPRSLERRLDACVDRLPGAEDDTTGVETFGA